MTASYATEYICIKNEENYFYPFQKNEFCKTSTFSDVYCSFLVKLMNSWIPVDDACESSTPLLQPPYKVYSDFESILSKTL